MNSVPSGPDLGHLGQAYIIRTNHFPYVQKMFSCVFSECISSVYNQQGKEKPFRSEIEFQLSKHRLDPTATLFRFEIVFQISKHRLQVPKNKKYCN